MRVVAPKYCCCGNGDGWNGCVGNAVTAGVGKPLNVGKTFGPGVKGGNDGNTGAGTPPENVGVGVGVGLWVCVGVGFGFGVVVLLGVALGVVQSTLPTTHDAPAGRADPTINPATRKMNAQIAPARARALEPFDPLIIYPTLGSP
jgi:hypothetical protein